MTSYNVMDGVSDSTPDYISQFFEECKASFEKERKALKESDDPEIRSKAYSAYPMSIEEIDSKLYCRNLSGKIAYEKDLKTAVSESEENGA